MFNERLWSTILGLLLLMVAMSIACNLEEGEGDEEVAESYSELDRAATTLYIRADGGSAEECNGLVDAPYPGDGVDQDCAWDHPFQALPPDDSPRIMGGDTVMIGSGSYMMGFGAPGADYCETDYTWDCDMPPVPGGPDPEHPTRILGQGWDGDCSDPPELWGTERADRILDLSGSDNVEIACLELTDHSGCVEDHTGGLACERDNYPYGPWAVTGLYAEDSANVHLKSLNIHGLSSTGIRAGRLSDWTVEDVRLAANGLAGWDGDLDDDDSNSGNMVFRRWLVEWNGCVESYPEEEPVGCWGQSAGGYGDGVGTGETGGNWIIEDSAFLHNTSDGLDLLYTRREDSNVTIRRTIAEGNAGNQIKTTGPMTLENVIAVSNCGFFDGQPFTHNVDYCRAGGNAITVYLRPGNQATIVNSTITGHGDCLIIAECQEDHDCDGSESVVLQNDILLGNQEFLGGGDITCMAWHDMPSDPFNVGFSFIGGIKEELASCPPDSFCNDDPGLVDRNINNFNAHLLDGSPAIDAGTTEGAPASDIDGNERDDRPDIGAYEW